MAIRGEPKGMPHSKTLSTLTTRKFQSAVPKSARDVSNCHSSSLALKSLYTAGGCIPDRFRFRTGS